MQAQTIIFIFYNSNLIIIFYKMDVKKIKIIYILLDYNILTNTYYIHNIQNTLNWLKYFFLLFSFLNIHFYK